MIESKFYVDKNQTVNCLTCSESDVRMAWEHIGHNLVVLVKSVNEKL